MYNNSDFGRIGVLMGGLSTEREISLKSGKAVYDALKKEDVDVAAIDFNTEKKEDVSSLLRDSQIDVAFIALHGKFGEDGTLQRILDTLDIPYTGSGALASQLAMDKIASRKLFRKRGLNVPESVAINKSLALDYKEILEKLKGFPLVVKPSSQGSSIGVSFVADSQSLKDAIDLALQLDDNILVEEYIDGRELTVSVLEEKPLPVVEIIPESSFFNFEAKYKSSQTKYIVPARIDAATAKVVQNAGLTAHKTLNCEGFSRTDMILRNDDTTFVLEVNTIPGLTSTSLLPKAASCVGIDFTQLCLKMLRLAYEKKQQKKYSQI